jgi:hypothetical protein
MRRSGKIRDADCECMLMMPEMISFRDEAESERGRKNSFYPLLISLTDYFPMKRNDEKERRTC